VPNIILERTPTPIALVVRVAMRGAGRDRDRRRAIIRVSEGIDGKELSVRVDSMMLFWQLKGIGLICRLLHIFYMFLYRGILLTVFAVVHRVGVPACGIRS
jgi:hypothetical protein